MKKWKSIILFILSVALIGFLGYVVLFGVADYGQAEHIKLGLDLEGGVSITYQVVDDDFTATDFSDTVYKLQLRVSNYSTEAEAYSEGDDRITVDIPGETDAEQILEDLGQPGSLYFVTIEDEVDEDDGYEYLEMDDGTIYKIWVSGDDVTDAEATSDTDSTTGANEYVVSLTFTDEGAEKFEEATTEYLDDTIYILYDEEIISAPTVESVISNGQAVINGMDTYEDADELASTIRIGSLSLELEEISHQVVGAKLGSDALSKCIKAGIVGFIIIALFLLIVYRIPGFAAVLSLLMYIALVLLTMNGFDLTLSLPGIAGIILGVGMAVDGNVIIFARIREEIAAGKDVRDSIRIGFKNATSAIVDGNITTLIAALVLMWRGSGTVQGFAQTLAISIIMSIFSSLVVSRVLMWLIYYMGFKKPGMYGKERPKKIFNILGKRRICFIVSIAAMLAGVIAMIVNGVNGNGIFYYSIEFAGGESVTVEFEDELTIDDFNDDIKPVLEEIVGSSNVQAQKDTESNSFTIKTVEMDSDTFDEFKQTLIDDFGAVDSDENFADTYISATVSSEMRQDAVIATILATICMLIYIWIRFKDIKFGVAAVIALVHDVLIVVAFYALSRTTVGTTFIACLLTIVGYSINATIVIFDRLRENMALMKREDAIEDTINLSISQTLTRSIYTSFTTFVMVFCIFIFGVTSIQEFTLPLMVGVVVGAYSSIFISGSLWYMMHRKFGSKKVKTVKIK